MERLLRIDESVKTNGKKGMDMRTLKFMLCLFCGLNLLSCERFWESCEDKKRKDPQYCEKEEHRNGDCCNNEAGNETKKTYTWSMTHFCSSKNPDAGQRSVNVQVDSYVSCSIAEDNYLKQINETDPCFRQGNVTWPDSYTTSKEVWRIEARCNP